MGGHTKIWISLGFGSRQIRFRNFRQKPLQHGSSGSMRVIVFTGSVQRVGAYGPSPPPCISLFALGRGCAQVTLRGEDKCPAQVTCKCHDFNSMRFSACQFGSIVVAHQSSGIHRVSLSAESAHRRSLNAMM